MDTNKLIEKLEALKAPYNVQPEASAYHLAMNDAIALIRQAEEQPSKIPVVEGRYLIENDGRVCWLYPDQSHRGISRQDVKELNQALGVVAHLRTTESVGSAGFDEISIDLSTGDYDAGLRAFASMPPVEIMESKGKRVALFEGYLNEPLPTPMEPVSVDLQAMRSGWERRKEKLVALGNLADAYEAGFKDAAGVKHVD